MADSEKEKGSWPSETLPSSWDWIPFEFVYKNVTSSSRKLKQKQYLQEGSIPVVDQGKELVGGYTENKDLLHESELPLIIFGDHTRCVKFVDFNFVQGADGVKVLKPTELYTPEFSYRALQAVKLPDKGYSRHYKFLKETFFPLPPSNEQKRIVDKIESLQAKSKKAKQALETAKPLLDKLRRSLLESAFRGDLTAEWRKKNPDVEPASVLLERIRKERRKKWEDNELAKMRAKEKEPKDDKWKLKYKEPEPLNHSELYKLPSGWVWSKMEDVSQIASNLVDPLLHLSYPHIAPDNIEKYTGRLFEYKTIQEDGVKSAKNKFFIGQIVYSKIRPYLSKCIIAHFDGLCSADMYPIDSYVDTNYLYYYILSNTFLYHIQKEAGNRVVLPKANQKQVYAVPVPIPPMSEQKKIAKKIEDMLIKKEFVEKFVSQSTEKIQKIDQSILKQAFCGDLVAQDPSDESAKDLLKKIKEG
jgi:type I restriction enzyme, S subunit